MAAPSYYKKIVVVKKTNASFEEATKIVEVPIPNLIEDQVLVKIHFAGVQASDVLQTAGVYGPLATNEPDAVHDGTHQKGDIGTEGVGEIVGVGPDAKTLKVGDFVAFWGFGVGFREYLPISEQQLIKVNKISPELVAIIVSGGTAYGAITQLGRVQKGDIALVTAAAGGTGQFAVQILKELGCHVIGTCGSEDKVKLLKEIGCDRSVNYKTENLDEVLTKEYPKGVNFVYEAVGGDMFSIAAKHLAEFGHLVFVGGVSLDYTSSKPASVPVDMMVQLFRSSTLSGYYFPNAKRADEVPQIQRTLIDKWEKGTLKVKLDPTEFYGLEGVYKAEVLMRSGKNTGKITIKIQ